jgi:hypothetical protein
MAYIEDFVSSTPLNLFYLGNLDFEIGKGSR